MSVGVLDSSRIKLINTFELSLTQQIPKLNLESNSDN